MDQESNVYDCIVGEKLSAITFVMDYLQFQFDGPMINAFARVQVIANGRALRNGEDQFRNQICGQIGKIVAEVTLAKLDAFIITFEDGSSISVSLKAEDQVGPEALYFMDGIRNADVL